jgi:tol-pal system protein YbgF
MAGKLFYIFSGIFLVLSSEGFADAPVEVLNPSNSEQEIASPVIQRTTQFLGQLFSGQSKRAHTPSVQSKVRTDVAVCAPHAAVLGQLRTQLGQLTDRVAHQQRSINQLRAALKPSLILKKPRRIVRQRKSHVQGSKASSVQSVVSKARPIRLSARQRQREQYAVGQSLAYARFYQHGLVSLQARRYAAAQKALQHYVNQAPHGQYIPSAYYWLGDMALLKKQYAQSAQYFDKLIHKFPEFSKTSEAYLKRSVIDNALGHRDQAREWLHRVMRRYPDSTAAHLAQLQLKQFSIQGML